MGGNYYNWLRTNAALTNGRDKLSRQVAFASRSNARPNGTSNFGTGIHTYSDYFQHKPTASGETYTHDGFTAALLPKSNWHALPFHTRLKLTYMGRAVVVEVNDVGGGAPDDPHRILDLSRAAMGALEGVSRFAITDSNATVINVDRIEVVPQSTPLGPVR